MRIVDTEGHPVRTLLDGGELEGGEHEQVFHWDGRTVAGDALRAASTGSRSCFATRTATSFPRERVCLRGAGCGEGS